MTPRSRSRDLTADLLHDLEAEETAPTTAPTSAPTARTPTPTTTPTRATAVAAAAEPAPVIETSLYLSPKAWRRPAISRSGRSVSVSVGPARLRIGRRPS